MPEPVAGETLGYVLLGVLISLWLSGVLSFQTLSFYTSYPNERKWMKAFVGFLILADGLQTLMGVAIIWDILIMNLGDTSAAKIPTQAFQIYPVLIALITSSVQIFFAWRIKVLSTNHILFAVVVVLAILQLVAGIMYSVLTINTGDFSKFSNFIGVIVGWVTCSTVCDLFITASLTMTLRRHRANQDLGEAVQLIHKIKVVSIYNGVVTILWSLALLIAMAAARKGAYYMFFYPLGKVYLITMLASLNSRPTALPVLGSGTQSALQGHASSSRAPEAGLYSSRESGDDGEKHGRSVISRTIYSHSARNRAVVYFPAPQEDEGDISIIQRNDRQQGHDPTEEVLLLVPEPPPIVSCSPSHRKMGSVSSRPRGPRLPAAPSRAARFATL